MRVLLLADHCNPHFSSTPFFGYKIVRAIARRVEHAALATQVRNRGAFTAEEAGVAELHFIDTEHVARPLHLVSSAIRGHRDKALTFNVAMSIPANYAFERAVWRQLGDRIRAGEFDVIHRVTPLSPTVPSPMASWSPAPFVIGPVNGGLRWPKAFAAELRREREWLAHVRDLYRLLPYARSTYTRAAAILAGFSHTIDGLPAEARGRAFVCSDVGFDDLPAPADNGDDGRDGSATVLFVGRLVPYKCPDVLVRAFAADEALRRHRLVLVGDGPDRPMLEQLVRDHDLGGCVELAGWLSHDEVIERMRAADVFAFPSIRELGAGVVAEAMGNGLACVVADYGAPGAYVADGCGIAVPVVDKDDLTRRFAEALRTLVDDPSLRRRLGEAARRRARENLTWDAKADNIVRLYEHVTGRRDERPEFPY